MWTARGLHCGGVNEYCSCGAQLPPDARFCHKCGKPQYELPVPDSIAEEPPPAAVPEVGAAAPLPGIGWRNPAAVRTTVLAGSVVSILLLIPLPPILNILWMFLVLTAGGFWAVHLYRKRTGLEVSIGSGARLGWMAGAFCFVVLLVVFTLNVVLVSATGKLQEALATALQASSSPKVAEQYDALLASPAGVATLLFAVVMTCFVLLPLFSTIGGALGAKILEKD